MRSRRARNIQKQSRVDHSTTHRGNSRRKRSPLQQRRGH
jgi:hypothetical protein